MEKTSCDMKVRLTPQAGEDIETIELYLIEKSPTGARSVLASLHAALEFIGRYPYAAEETSDGDLRVKILSDYPFKIFYEIRKSAVEILHIRHDSREPWGASRGKG